MAGLLDMLSQQQGGGGGLLGGMVQGPAPTPSPYVITPGPDYNKWDEALHRHGRILLPKSLDEPQQWLNQKHFQDFLQGNGVDRQDLPDGSVILSKQAFTS